MDQCHNSRLDQRKESLTISHIGNFLVTADSSFFTQLLNKKNALSSEIVIWSDKFEATKDAGK